MPAPSKEWLTDWQFRQAVVRRAIFDLPWWAWYRERKLFKEWDTIIRETDPFLIGRVR